MRRVTASLLDRVLAGRAIDRILDAGCGTGKNLELLGRYGTVTGVDFSADAIEFLRLRGAKTVIQASVDGLPFADASFDLVTSFDVLYHRAVRDPHRVVGEFGRVLRPGGILVLRVPAFEWLRGRHDVAVQTARRFTLPQLTQMLTQAGFAVHTASYLNTSLLPLAIGRRLVDRWTNARGDDLALPPAPVNWLLSRLLGAEAALVTRAGLPIGVSAIAVGVLAATTPGGQACPHKTRLTAELPTPYDKRP